MRKRWKTSHLAHALPPPVETARQRVPAVERDAPVLPPFVGERVLQKRPPAGAAAPDVIKNLRLRPHVRAVIADAKRDVAHERHALRVRVVLHRRPLLPREPLHVAAKAHPQLDLAAAAVAVPPASAAPSRRSAAPRATRPSARSRRSPPPARGRARNPPATRPPRGTPQTQPAVPAPARSGQKHAGAASSSAAAPWDSPLTPARSRSTRSRPVMEL